MAPDEIPATRIVPDDETGISAAAALLRAGEPVVFPTETVYGLGANALDDHAVSRIFAIKNRPRFNPLIIHVADWAAAGELVETSGMAAELAHRFWPGGLTLVLPRRASSPVSLLASAGLSTLAVRAPAHCTAQALIARAGVPVAAPSANRSGRISPTTAGAAREELDTLVGLIIDSGPCRAGVESTIIGFDHNRPVLLRPGAVAREEIEAVTGKLMRYSGSKIAAPGSLASHYAPHAKLRLNAATVQPGEALLAFGTPPADATEVLNLSPGGNLREAAANLFSMLRRLDERRPNTIAVMPIPDTGLGEAINDRLMRAAAPRDRP